MNQFDLGGEPLNILQNLKQSYEQINQSNFKQSMEERET